MAKQRPSDRSVLRRIAVIRPERCFEVEKFTVAVQCLLSESCISIFTVYAVAD